MAVLKHILVLTLTSLLINGCSGASEITPQPETFDNDTTMTKTPKENISMSGDSSTADAGANYARDGNIAIEEEFQDAEIKGTVAAYEMFIARHPDHDLSKLAKIRIAEIKAR